MTLEFVWVSNNNRTKRSGYEWPTIMARDLFSSRQLAALLPDYSYLVKMKILVREYGNEHLVDASGMMNKRRDKVYLNQGAAPLHSNATRRPSVPGYACFHLLIDLDSVTIEPTVHEDEDEDEFEESTV